MTDELIRISKLLAQRGLCSRREADEYIAQGLVLVDGVVVRELGAKVHPDQRVELSKTAQTIQSARVTILLNKPVGYVSGQPENDYPPAVKLLTPENQFSGRGKETIRKEHFAGLAPAGRLDIDSRGLLVFTQDGPLAKLLTGNTGQIEKEYHVKVRGEITGAKLDRLRHGLELDGKPLLPARVGRLGTDRLRFSLQEGRHRQVRRMCEMVDLHVLGLMRVRIGEIRLGTLPEGRWRFLQPGESFLPGEGSVRDFPDRRPGRSTRRR